jgi:hypothetical protein
MRRSPVATSSSSGAGRCQRPRGSQGTPAVGSAAQVTSLYFTTELHTACWQAAAPSENDGTWCHLL